MDSRKAHEGGNDRHCFVCGPDNPIGLKVRFSLEGGESRAEFTPGPEHQGYRDLMHGGILGCLLDDVMANWFYLQGIRAFTGRMELRFREPVPLGTRVELVGRLVERRGKRALMAARATRSGGKVVAEAKGTFMILSEESEEERP